MIADPVGNDLVRLASSFVREISGKNAKKWRWKRLTKKSAYYRLHRSKKGHVVK